jgi:small subunit ribosomal protein S6
LETAVKRLYEGLFLVDTGEATSDWEGVQEAINRVLERGECEIVSLRKWDERRLAYDIKGVSRGTYFLAYFRCDPTNIAAIERDVQLSERLIRVMILRGDHLTEEEMAKDTPAMIEDRGERERKEEEESPQVDSDYNYESSDEDDDGGSEDDYDNDDKND